MCVRACVCACVGVCVCVRHLTHHEAHQFVGQQAGGDEGHPQTHVELLGALRLHPHEQTAGQTQDYTYINTYIHRKIYIYRDQRATDQLRAWPS